MSSGEDVARVRRLRRDRSRRSRHGAPRAATRRPSPISASRAGRPRPRCSPSWRSTSPCASGCRATRAVRLPWLVPAIEGVLLALLLVGNPGGLAKHRKWLRRVAVTFVCILVVAALWATVLLVYDLIKGLGVTNSPGRAPGLRRGGLARQQPLVRAALLADRQRRAGRTLAAGGPGRLRLHPAHEPGARAARLEAGLPRLPAPRLHQRDRVQPDRRDAAHAPRQVHDARAVNRRARALRPDRRAGGQRVHVTLRRSQSVGRRRRPTRARTRPRAPRARRPRRRGRRPGRPTRTPVRGSPQRR